MGIQSIKPEQLEIVAGIVKAMHLRSCQQTMACFQCLPRLNDKLTESPCHSIVLVITPLRIVFVAPKL